MTTVCCRYDPVLAAEIGNAIKGNLMRKRTKSHKSGSHSECPTPAARTASLPAGGRPEIINTSNSELRIESSPATLSNAPSPSIHLSDADIADHREFHDHAATEVNSRIYVKVTQQG